MTVIESDSDEEEASERNEEDSDSLANFQETLRLARTASRLSNTSECQKASSNEIMDFEERTNSMVPEVGEIGHRTSIVSSGGGRFNAGGLLGKLTQKFKEMKIPKESIRSPLGSLRKSFSNESHEVGNSKKDVKLRKYNTDGSLPAISESSTQEQANIGCQNSAVDKTDANSVPAQPENTAAEEEDNSQGDPSSVVESSASLTQGDTNDAGSAPLTQSEISDSIGIALNRKKRLANATVPKASNDPESEISTVSVLGGQLSPKYQRSGYSRRSVEDSPVTQNLQSLPPQFGKSISEDSRVVSSGYRRKNASTCSSPQVTPAEAPVRPGGYKRQSKVTRCSSPPIPDAAPIQQAEREDRLSVGKTASDQASDASRPRRGYQRKTQTKDLAPLGEKTA
eukprot:gnl/MRDRNA2_/MRDRNA2_72234_c0_seq1.p1 gnl/MRDRNA2_/MRDRNA2_72234_c0~~gnl/MRDRNA2_/MRDRNA2_72234_c0_seq1.p1  ORF type:complete len:414 (+),score=67.51 gnl/MRDRNA2_/MRDRNA2_72234_c0_seq1:54-1244(+)